MIKQLKTIREAHDLLIDGDLLCEVKAAGLLRAALTQLEAMVGEQEPVGEMVAWPDDHQRVGVEWSDGMPEIGTKLYAAPVAQQPQAEAVPDIDHMATRLMGWRLPDDFRPDGGIAFDPYEYHREWPTGTNLLTHEQAKAMFEYVLEVKP